MEYTNSDNFMGRALQLGQARGPSAETGKGKEPSVAARGPALRPHDKLFPCVICEINLQLIGEGGASPKIILYEITGYFLL